MSGDDLRGYLGPPRQYVEAAERASIPGVAVGLAWTPTGGDILFIESTRMGGKGNVILTGHLGEVMQESARTALSVIRSRAKAFGLDDERFAGEDIHIHVPEGAIPKDGPSAGVAIVVSLMSVYTGRPARSDTAMTGEITLRGKVLPVGGIKEKILAARRAGIKNIVLPDWNRNDIDEIPAAHRKGLNFEFVKTVDEVLQHAFDGRAAGSGDRKTPAGGKPSRGKVATPEPDASKASNGRSAAKGPRTRPAGGRASAGPCPS